MNDLLYLVTIVGLLLVAVGILTIRNATSPQLAYFGTAVGGMGVMLLVTQSIGRLLGH